MYNNTTCMSLKKNIHYFRCNVEKKSFKIEVILRFLQQLYSTYINKEGISTVTICIKQIYKFKKSTNNNLYYVRCDIQDAFGSIKQGIIYISCSSYLD